MSDKFDATFFGMSDDDMRILIDGLMGALKRDERRQKIKIAVRNLTTTLCITAGFTVCLLGLGWWGYVPAILGTASYFTIRDFRTLTDD